MPYSYRGSEILREVAWVIFDEIHYMRDKERGVVWEETIIMLPHKVRFVFLSATIPNAKEFAGWVSSIHKQPCHVVYTDYRPTPLQHFLFPQGGEGVFLVVDEKGTFREDNFHKAMAVLVRRVAWLARCSLRVVDVCVRACVRAGVLFCGGVVRANRRWKTPTRRRGAKRRNPKAAPRARRTCSASLR